MKIKPLGNNVVIKVIETENKTAGGILIPEIVKELKRSISGNVIAIGPDVSSIKIGDEIIFNTLKIKGIKIDSEEYHILKDYDILAKYEKDNNKLKK